ncbi:MAG: hypothetical protein OQK82_05365, partial [Candidatus Pacearchaeota archaeon]|nr:hypothetical protein [Candidatus Pacearchaeota archaeon]
MSGGKNTTDPPHAVLDNQVCDTLNLLHENVGLSRAPGYLGINTDSIGTVTGLIRYLTDSGTEIIIVIDTEKIYSFDTSTGELSEIYTITTSENRWTYVNSCGKVWLCNGIDFLSIDEDLNVYPVGLPVPEPSSNGLGPSMLTSGGYLVFGTYKIYCAYVTTDNVGRKMYSYPLYLGEVTLIEPYENGSLILYYRNSESARVDHIAFFITNPDGEVPYLYYEVENVVSGGDGYFILTSDEYKNELITVSSVSLSNAVLPIVPDNIYAFDSRIFVWENNSKAIYFSLKSDVNPFDLERFLSANFRLMPKSVDSMFSVGSDLFFNHIGNGISVAYFGDMTSVVKHINRQFWFLDCTTQEGKTNVVYISGMVFGLTNDGFRFFDGAGFSDDISSPIKPEIDRIYTVISNKVSACVYRRPGKRTEYRFSYENS